MSNWPTIRKLKQHRGGGETPNKTRVLGGRNFFFRNEMWKCKPIEKTVNAKQLCCYIHKKGSNRHLHNLSCAHILGSTYQTREAGYKWEDYINNLIHASKMMTLCKGRRQKGRCRVLCSSCLWNTDFRHHKSVRLLLFCLSDTRKHTQSDCTTLKTETAVSSETPGAM